MGNCDLAWLSLCAKYAPRPCELQNHPHCYKFTAGYHCQSLDAGCY